MITRTRLCALLFISLPFSIYGQDSLVYLKDITFSSPYEKEIFREKTDDSFALFVANGSLLTEAQIEKAKDQFYSYLDIVNDEKFKSKKNDKKVKQLINGLQSQYLKKYKGEGRFEEIFHNGSFNEVSGTALYCLAFDYLKIPYEIKEEATNVYVIAYPLSEKMMIESTLASVTFITFDAAFKQAFVQTILKQKIISEEEYARGTVNDLFDEYYFNNKTVITLRGLAGLHYLMDGLSMAENETYENAFLQIEKSYFLYPSPKATYLLMETARQAFFQHTEKDIKQAALLGKVSRHRAIGTTDEMIAAEFYKVVQFLLFDKGQLEKLTNYYETLLNTITNIQTQKEVSFVFEYENGRYLYNQARYTEALPYFERALHLKPTNQDAASILINTLGQLASNQIQQETFCTKLAAFHDKFPELRTNNLFNSLLASSYLVQFALLYESDNVLKGDSYRKKFESLYETSRDLNVNSYLLGKAYSTAAVYYFKKGQTKKAQEYLTSGLKISPENYELLSRQRMIR